MNALDQLIAKRNNPEFNQKRDKLIEFYHYIFNLFFDKVEDWLKPYKEAGELSYRRYDNWKLKLEETGEIFIDWIKINFHGTEVSLFPQQNILADAVARIDMFCSPLRDIFVFAPKSDNEEMDDKEILDLDLEKFEWKWLSNNIRGGIEELDREKFLDLFGKMLQTV